MGKVIYAIPMRLFHRSRNRGLAISPIYTQKKIFFLKKEMAFRLIPSSAKKRTGDFGNDITKA